MTFIIESLFAGFISAIGWWSANDYVIDPYLKKKPEQVQQVKEEPKKEEPKKEDPSKENRAWTM
jgi:hypothetical protein